MVTTLRGGERDGMSSANGFHILRKETEKGKYSSDEAIVRAQTKVRL